MKRTFEEITYIASDEDDNDHDERRTCDNATIPTHVTTTTTSNNNDNNNIVVVSDDDDDDDDDDGDDAELKSSSHDHQVIKEQLQQEEYIVRKRMKLSSMPSPSQNNNDSESTNHIAEEDSVNDSDHNTCTLNDLPPEIFMVIFGHLSLYEIMNCSHVCMAWRFNVIAQHNFWNSLAFPVVIGFSHSYYDKNILTLSDQPEWKHDSMMKANSLGLSVLNDWLAKFSVYKSEYRRDLCTRYMSNICWNLYQNSLAIDDKELHKLVHQFPNITKLEIKLWLPTMNAKLFDTIVNQVFHKYSSLTHLKVQFLTAGQSQTDVDILKGMDKSFVELFPKLNNRRLQSFVLIVPQTIQHTCSPDLIESLHNHHPDLHHLHLSRISFDLLRALGSVTSKQLLPRITHLYIDYLDIRDVEKPLANILFKNLTCLKMVCHFSKSLDVMQDLIANRCPELTHLDITLKADADHQFVNAQRIHYQPSISHSPFFDQTSSQQLQHTHLTLRNTSLKRVKVFAASVLVTMHLDNIQFLETDCLERIASPIDKISNNTLRTLSLKALHMDATHLEEISEHCTGLRSLYIERSAAITSLNLHISNMIELQIHNFPKLSALSFIQQQECSTLQRFEISECKSLESIQVLNSTTQVTDDLKKLRVISIANLHQEKDHSVWQSLMNSASYTSLQEIRLSFDYTMSPMKTFQLTSWIRNSKHLKRLSLTTSLATVIPQLNIESDTLEEVEIQMIGTYSCPLYVNCPLLTQLRMVSIAQARIAMNPNATVLDLKECHITKIQFLSTVSPESLLFSTKSIREQPGCNKDAWRQNFSFERLKNLSITTTDCNVLDEQMLQHILSNCHIVETIQFSGILFGGAFLTFQQMPLLKKLSIKKCSTIHCITMGELPDIRILDLEGCSALCRLNLAGNGTLFNNLVSCNLRGTKVTDEFLCKLVLHSNEQSLQRINAYRVQRLSTNMRKALQKLNFTGKANRATFEAILEQSATAESVQTKQRPRSTTNRKKKGKKSASTSNVDTRPGPDIVIEEIL